MTDDAAAILRSRLTGDVLTPDDIGYDDARAVWNGVIDRRPAVIARCADTDDVVAAITYARGHALPVTVRGGGHNVAGGAMGDGALVVDLSQMTGVDVDADRQLVRVAGGATIGHVDRATQQYGLAVPLGVASETGIAGLTLGGGLGWLRRAHGMSCDNLVAAEVVTASGDRVRTSEEQNPELLWGLRGGGGGLGVVTTFEYRAHPVGPEVPVHYTLHPWSDSMALMRHYRDWAGTAPDAVSSFAILWHAPAIDEIPSEYHHQPVLVYLAVHCGDPDQAERDLAPLRAAGAPIADLGGMMPYVEVQQLFDEDYPAHVMRYYWKSLQMNGLDDDALSLLAELNEAAPSAHSTIDIWQLGGEFSRIGTADTAFGDRLAPFLLGIEANWEDPADDDVNIAWARRVHRELERFSTGAQYLNFPGFNEDGEQMLRTTLGPNYERMAALRNEYDPVGLFLGTAMHVA